MGRNLALLLVMVVCLAGCRPHEFSGQRALKHVEALYGLGPRYVGNDANREAADYIAETLARYGWEVTRQDFAYGGERLQNVIATRGSGATVLLGTHYDTRPVAENDPLEPNSPVPGANDGASGVGVLLEVARTLDPTITADRRVMLASDGEDRRHRWLGMGGARHRTAVGQRRQCASRSADPRHGWRRQSEPFWSGVRQWR